MKLIIKITNYCTVTETYYKHRNVDSQYQLQHHTHCTIPILILLRYFIFELRACMGQMDRQEA